TASAEIGCGHRRRRWSGGSQVRRPRQDPALARGLARRGQCVARRILARDRSPGRICHRHSRPTPEKGRLMDDRPRYTISVAAEIVGMHPQTLRIYEAKGLVRPGRTKGGTRLYSERDLERLRAIQRLTTELGLNLAGVDRVLTLEDEMTKLRARLERME